ncbi:MAG: hypothetical protein JW904_00330, partial [Spirochaetales bacterium]|nr:hypothetical protein [Spirochaetales bacterium]
LSVPDDTMLCTVSFTVSRFRVKLLLMHEFFPVPFMRSETYSAFGENMIRFPQKLILWGNLILKVALEHSTP